MEHFLPISERANAPRKINMKPTQNHPGQLFFKPPILGSMLNFKGVFQLLGVKTYQFQKSWTMENGAPLQALLPLERERSKFSFPKMGRVSQTQAPNIFTE